MGNRGDFLEYSETVRRLTEQTLKKEFLHNKELRSMSWHCDHKLSIKSAYLQGIEPEFVSHICNLEIIHSKYNQQKGSNDSITFEELLNEINQREIDLYDLLDE